EGFLQLRAVLIGASEGLFDFGGPGWALVLGRRGGEKRECYSDAAEQGALAIHQRGLRGGKGQRFQPLDSNPLRLQTRQTSRLTCAAKSLRASIIPCPARTRVGT